MPSNADRTPSAAQDRELLGYAVVEQAIDGTYDLMLGTTIFEPGVVSARSLTDRMIGSRHARVRWLGWLLRIRRYVAFDWSRGPWPR